MNKYIHQHTDHLRQSARQALYLGLLTLVVLMGFSGCTTVKKEEQIGPNDPYKIPIGNLVIEADTFGIALLPIASLHLDHSKPFTFASRDFHHGDFDIQGDSVLVYVATDTGNWKSDSGYVKVSQSGQQPKEGFLKIINTVYTPPVVATWNVSWLKGTPVPDMSPLYLDFGDPRNLPNLTGMEEAGSLIDSIWGYVYNCIIKSDKLSLTYSVPPFSSENFGTDHIYYRIKRPNGLYFRGMIPIFIGDTAQPNAENDVVPILPVGTFIPWSQLMENDKGSSVVGPRSPFSMRLRPISYTGTVLDSARFGTIQDYDSSGIKGFFYKRMIAGNENDTTYIFLQEGPENRITRSRLILTQ